MNKHINVENLRRNLINTLTLKLIDIPHIARKTQDKRVNVHICIMDLKD